MYQRYPERMALWTVSRMQLSKQDHLQTVMVTEVIPVSESIWMTDGPGSDSEGGLLLVKHSLFFPTRIKACPSKPDGIGIEHSICRDDIIVVT